MDASTGLATSVVRALDAAGVLVDNIEVRQPSLDDVFFTLTGGHIEEDDDEVVEEVGLDPDGEGRGAATGPVESSVDEHGAARAGRSADMTTTTLTDDHRRSARSPVERGVRWRTGRHLGDDPAQPRAHLREPMQLSDVTLQPVLFTVLFVYIFGGAIPIPGGGSGVDYLLAGMLSLNLVTSIMGTAVGLSTDLHEGMIDRFRALPMWRSAVLVGRSMADLLTSCLCALIVGTDRAGRRVAARVQLHLDRGRLRTGAVLRVRLDLDRCLAWA